MSSFFLFILGLVLLLTGSQGVVSNAIRISILTKIPSFVIGITIVAIGTSLPEIVVSFFGGLEKAPELALGNIVGSNIANIGFVLGASLLCNSLMIGRKTTQKNMYIMLLVSLLLFFILFIDGLTFWHGVGFIVAGCGIVIWLILQGKHSGLGDIEDMKDIKPPKQPFNAIALFLMSLVFLFVGGKLLVDGGIAVAHLLKIPPVIIGAVAVALGTSLPELAVSITALIRHPTIREEKLVVGNILGSNIFNILFGAGILGLFGIKNFGSAVSLYTFLIFTIVVCLLLFLFRGKEMPRYIGIGCIIMYCVYLIFLVLWEA